MIYLIESSGLTVSLCHSTYCQQLDLIAKRREYPVRRRLTRTLITFVIKIQTKEREKYKSKTI